MLLVVLLLGLFLFPMVPASNPLARRSGESSTAAQAANVPVLPLAFVYGMFEDANYVGEPSDFEDMLNDLKRRHFDSVMFTNNFTNRDEPLLNVSDRLDFNVIFAPHAELNDGWWASDVPPTIQRARRVIYPIVNHLKDHPSLKAYNILDDASNRLSAKAALAVQAFQERDPTRPASPIFIQGNEQVYLASRPGVFITYVYPVTIARPPCDFAGGTSLSSVDDLADSIRLLSMETEQRVPVWIILQGHGMTRDYDPRHADTGDLREPTVEEVRLQQWVALGEGVKGIFWFIYSTQQFWTGLHDNPQLYAEVSDLAARVEPMRGILATLRKVDDLFTVSSAMRRFSRFRPYVSTLEGPDGTLYVVAANGSCSAQRLTLESSVLRGQLQDVETNRFYELGSPISFRGGDGKLFRLVDEQAGAR